MSTEPEDCREDATCICVDSGFDFDDDNSTNSSDSGRATMRRICFPKRGDARGPSNVLAPFSTSRLRSSGAPAPPAPPEELSPVVYYRSVFSESLLVFGVSSGEFGDFASRQPSCQAAKGPGVWAPPRSATSSPASTATPRARRGASR